MDITIASFDAISEVNMVSISFLPHFRVDFAELPQTDPIIFFLLLLLLLLIPLSMARQDYTLTLCLNQYSIPFLSSSTNYIEEDGGSIDY